ncbi:MAG: hypothetical protein WC789_01565 [Lentisphaeria bacterium]
MRNGDFTQVSGDRPVAWTIVESGQKVTAQKPDDRAGALRVEIVREAGKSAGEIRQTVKVRKNQKYRLSAEIKSSKANVALMQVKPRAGRQELGRLNTASSGTEWTKVSKEFDSGAAEEVQVLCRFFQKAEHVGAICWFTNVELVALDAEGQPLASAPAAAPAAGSGPASAAPKPAPVNLNGSDQYVLPKPSGDGSGKDFANARGVDSLQAALDAAGAGNTVRLGSGEYGRVTLTFTTGGTSDKPKTLLGVDTGAGLPVFTSNFDGKNPAQTGGTFLTVPGGVSHLEIKDIILKGFNAAVRLRGGNVGVRLSNVDLSNGRDAFWFEGEGIRDLVVKDCDVKKYTKRAFRIVRGVSEARFENCHADAGGKENALEIFPVGFQVIEGEKITFSDCSAANNWHDAGPNKYWNADGFCSERKATDLTFIRCLAYGNTDGGWDLKSNRSKLVNCIGIANKRNFRFWASPEPAVMENCLSAFAIDYGKRGHDLGVWQQSGGGLVMKNCTLWGDPVSLVIDQGIPGKPTPVTLEKCLIVPAAGKSAQQFSPGVEVENRGSIVAENGQPAVQLKNPSPTWRGGDDSFDSTSHPDAGYRFASGAAGR